MRPSSLALTLALALLAACLAAPGQGAEVAQSTMLDAEQSKPWRGVGRVNVGSVNSRGLCTGTLIAPDLVLTAAHCVVRANTGATHPAGNVHFVAGWHKGEMTGHSLAAEIAVHPDYRRDARSSPAALAADLAIIRLEEPMVETSAVPFGVAIPPLPGAPVTILSYRRDRAHALTYQDDCAYGAIVGTILTLDCAVTSGASGAPVFVEVEGRPTLVAVLVASGRSREGPKAYAARADLAVELLRGLLP